MTEIPDQLAYSPKDARARIGISHAKFYRVLNSGELPARKLGKRTVILANDLNAYLQSLPSYEPRCSPPSEGAGPTDAIGNVLGKGLANRAA